MTVDTDDATSTLRLVPKGKGEIDADIVGRIEFLLGLAKGGEVAGIVFAATHVDGSVTSGHSKSADRLRLAGALDWARYRLIKLYDEDD